MFICILLLLSFFPMEGYAYTRFFDYDLYQLKAKSSNGTVYTFPIEDLINSQRDTDQQMNGSLAHSQDDSEFIVKHYSLIKPLKPTANWIWITKQSRKPIEDFALAAMYNIRAFIYTSVSEKYKIGTVPSNIEFMAQISEEDANVLDEFNAVNSPLANVTMEQKVAFRCSLVQEFRPSYIIIVGLWHLAFLWWFFYVRSTYKQSLRCLHHIFSLLPALKTVETIVFFLITLKCPWERENVSALRGVEYTIIFLSASYDTIFLAALLLLSKGYNVTTSVLTRAQFNTIVCFFGLIYLVFNSYYIAKPPEAVVFVFQILILVMTVCVHISVHVSAITICKALDMQLNSLRVLENIARTVRIKKRMMWAFLFSVHCFFGLLYVCTVVPYFSISEYQSELMAVLKELVLFFVLLFYLFLFHPSFFDENFDYDPSELIHEDHPYTPFVEIDLTLDELRELAQERSNVKGIKECVIIKPVEIVGERHKGIIRLGKDICIGRALIKYD